MIDSTYYHFAIASIQAVDSSVDSPGSKDIYGELFDNNKEELQKWIALYQNKWSIYGLKVMCDG